MSNYVISCKQILAPEPLSERVIWISGGKIVALGQLPAGDRVGPDKLEQSSFKALDYSQLIATPGLIDLQVNGSPACNFWADPSPEDLIGLRLEHARCGVTAFLPTLITAPAEKLVSTRDFLKEQGVGACLDACKGTQSESRTKLQPAGKGGSDSPYLSRMPGIHLEGPCLSPAKPGVHPAKHIQPLTKDLIDRLIDPSVLMMTAAFEQDQSGDNQKLLQDKGVKASLGHSNATFDEANRSFERGAKLLTHTFNALPPLHHRQPGAVGAALLDRSVTCCLIADGLHLEPAICDLIYRLKGADKTILVTDRATVGTLNGGLVGASIILDEAVRNFVNWKICSLSDAVKMASTNPAQALGLEMLGRIAPGKFADLAFFDDALEVRQSLVCGEVVPR